MFPMVANNVGCCLLSAQQNTLGTWNLVTFAVKALPTAVQLVVYVTTKNKSLKSMNGVLSIILNPSSIITRSMLTSHGLVSSGISLLPSTMHYPSVTLVV